MKAYLPKNIESFILDKKDIEFGKENSQEFFYDMVNILFYLSLR